MVRVRITDVGLEILRLAQNAGAGTIFVVGTAKNAGKTVTIRELYRATYGAGVSVAIGTVGRDGEALDALDARTKPRLRLQPGTVFATAAEALPAAPPSLLLDDSEVQTAAGTMLYAKVRHAALYELVGPPTASGVAQMVRTLRRHAAMTLVDGSVDRVAALAAEPGSVVIAAGIGDAASMDDAVANAAGLAARLKMKQWDPGAPSLRISGALTASRIAELLATGDRRQVVVDDPTQLVLGGTSVPAAMERLRIRCRRPIRPVAATVAPSDGRRAYEPQAFAAAVAAATGLPTFDVYASTQAA